MGDLMAAFEGRIADVILEKVNIVDLVSAYVPLKRMGRNYKACCPFHNEKTPSFVVSEDKQLYHCFGCGVGGNAIGFVMAQEHLDFLDAVEWIADKYHIDLEPYRKNTSRGNQDQRKVLQDLSREVAIIYYKALKKSEKALQYLEQRKIEPDTAKQFAIGYASEGWDDLVRSFPTTKHKQLESIGLLSKRKNGSGYVDLFRDRLMFPIFNVQGKIVGFGGRIFGDGQPKYLNSPESEIFSKSNLLYGLNFVKAWSESQKRIVVVEGYLDVIQLHQAGFKGAVATLGTALTKQHGDILSRYTDEIVVCYDGDSAGIKAAIRSVEVLKNIKANVRVLILPNGLDPDDFIKQNGLDAFEELLKMAEPGLNFYLNALQEKYDVKTETGRIGIVQAFGEVLNELDNAIQKDIHIKRLSELIQVTESAVLDHLKKIKHRRPIINETSRGETQIEPHEETFVLGQRLEREMKKSTNKTKNIPMQQIEVRLMEIALQGQEAYLELMNYLSSHSFQIDSIKRVIEGLAVYYAVYTELEGDTLAEVFDLEMAQKLIERKESMVPIADIKKEIEANVLKHQELLIDEEIKVLRQERKVIMNQNHMNEETKDAVQQLMGKEMELKKMKSRMRQGMNQPKGGQAFE